MHNITTIHFIGIGGIGMSGIAEVLHHLGYKVQGSDQKESSIISRLKRLGVKVFIGHHAKNIQDADVVVLSSAILNNNIEYQKARDLNMPTVTRAQMLAELMRYRYSIAVSGTHGKTTTTSLIASIFDKYQLDPTFVIGGQVKAFDKNSRLGKGKYLIAEADESDASFLHLLPAVIVITNIDFDHMQTYNNDMNELKEAFISFVQKIPFYSYSVICFDDINIREILPNLGRKFISYGFDLNSDVCATDIKVDGMQSSFVVKRKNNKDLLVTINIPGKHNILNALAAIAVSCEEGVEDDVIVKGLLDFQGVGRRFQFKGYFLHDNHSIMVIDDYGHHPTELKATIETVKNSFSHKRLIMIFQPHRYTRTLDLYDDFVKILSNVDFLIMLDVYSAGESIIPSATSSNLCASIRKISNKDPILVENSIESVITILNKIITKDDIIVCQGAGNVTDIAKQLVV